MNSSQMLLIRQFKELNRTNKKMKGKKKKKLQFNQLNYDKLMGWAADRSVR